jgi:hypothetical protein
MRTKCGQNADKKTVSHYRYFRLSIMKNSSDSAPNVRILSAQEVSAVLTDRLTFFEYTVHCIDQKEPIRIPNFCSGGDASLLERRVGS